MANKRMINKTIVDSDAFLDMPQTTSNLYFHLNLRADDDGFVDSPKQVMRSIGSNQNDLEILLAKRYLLAFHSGVIVIKHWKLHNTIRKDRYKPTLYQEELKTLIEKDNGSYTESYKALEQQELEQWQPNDNQTTTNGTHRLGLDKSRVDIGKINKKKINKKESQPFEKYTGEPEKPKSKLDDFLNYWNDKITQEQLPTTLNLSPTTEHINFIQITELEHYRQCVDNYAAAYDFNKSKMAGFRSSLNQKFIMNWYSPQSVENCKQRSEIGKKSNKKDDDNFQKGGVNFEL